MTIWSTPRDEPERMRLSDFPATTGELLGATAEETAAEWPVVQAAKLSELQTARGEREDIGALIERVQQGEDLGEVATGPRPAIARTPMQDARQRVKDEGLDGTLKLPDATDIATPALDIMLERARERRQREQVIARGPSGFIPGALSMGTSFLVGAVDPLNVASAFIPVVGELRYGKMLADAGTFAGRARVAATVGAASGAIGVTALQPLDAYSRTLEGQDWHFTHSLQNVLFGAALGGILMGGGRAAGDVVRARAGRPLYPFDVGELLDDHPAWSELRAPRLESQPLAAEAFPGERPVPDLPERYPGFDDDLVPTPAAAIIADLPPRAQEDAMRVALAALVNGEPVRAGEMLQAAARLDPRIAESFDAPGSAGQPLRAESPAVDPERAWRDLSNATPAHSAPDVLAAAEAAARLEPPPSTVPFDPQSQPAMRQKAPGRDDGPGTAEQRTGGAPNENGSGGPPDPVLPEARSVSARAAAEAERAMLELYEAEAQGGFIDAADRIALNQALERIDQETAAHTAVIREGAACLLAGFGAMAR